MRFRSVFLLLWALTLTLTGCSSAQSSTASRAQTLSGTHSSTASPAPMFNDPTAEATRLVTQFFTLLEHRDASGLDQFLSPAFQVERADGSGANKSQYLTSYPAVKSFQITDVSGTEANSVIVARYLVRATGLVNGKPYTPGPAPRLSTFAWNGSSWQITSHANFNSLTS